ncbi:biotin/lipoyl-containing protein [Citricoccus sp. NPDC079358]|uniref:acetyl-CoA carboxylase biotin carboxyl carrier protein n=1 Tax=Citricoccus sp. NPDC079358 TaxID=3154653 RepID=UPI00344C80DB
MNFDLEELAAIIEQLDQTEFTDFRFEHGDLRLHVRRGGYDAGPGAFAPAAPAAGAGIAAAPAPAAAPATPALAAAPAPAPATAPAPADSTAGAGLDPAALPEGHMVVKAPMLGTFYGAPKPGAAPFVQVGDAVGPETTLCIIEVMKLMNSVSAGVTGEVAAVFLHDGELAEFDQPLFAVKVTA